MRSLIFGTIIFYSWTLFPARILITSCRGKKRWAVDGASGRKVSRIRAPHGMPEFLALCFALLFPDGNIQARLLLCELSFHPFESWILDDSTTPVIRRSAEPYRECQSHELIQRDTSLSCEEFSRASETSEEADGHPNRNYYRETNHGVPTVRRSKRIQYSATKI